MITKLVKDHPVPHATTARFLRFVDVGDYSPFELAAIYQIWQSMSPAERQQVEKLPPGPRRQELSSERARPRQIAAALKPQAFDEVAVDQQSGGFARRIARSRLAARIEKQGRRAARRDSPPASDQLSFSRDRPARRRSIQPGLPNSWLRFRPGCRSCFDHHSPDEAKRRLTVVYRLVFPPGHEIQGGGRSAATSTGERTDGPAAGPAAKKPAGKASSGTGQSPF